MKVNPNYQGVYIMAEGIDTSGKTTQLNLAQKYFKNRGYDMMVTRQPGGTRIGQEIRNILLNPENSEMHSDTETLLYIADRTQHMREVITPYLKNEKGILFQDRGQFATKTYQGYGRGLDMKNIDWLNNLAVGKYHPDSVLFFDISIDTMQKRKSKRNQEYNMEDDRLEQAGISFFERVRKGMHECAKKNPDLITIINSERSIEEIHEGVITHIDKIIYTKWTI